MIRDLSMKDTEKRPGVKTSAVHLLKKGVRKWTVANESAHCKAQSPSQTIQAKVIDVSWCGSFAFDNDLIRDSKLYSTYKIIMSAGASSWTVVKQFSDFLALQSAIKKKYPNFQMRIPAKKLFKNNNTPAFIKQRKIGLNDFIQKLVSNPQICQHPDVRAFLQIDQNQPQETDAYSDSTIGSDEFDLSPSNSVKPSDFDYLRIIGKGSFGKVLLAKHKETEKYFAVKVLQKKVVLKKKEQKHIMAERSVLLKNVKHPFLVGLHYSFQTADKLYFVLDYVNGGELFYHLQREHVFLEPRARFYSAEIASALGYLHALNIVYRDLKPENILLDSQGHIVLTDFGLCKEGVEPDGTTSTFCGTPEYLAPEVLQKQAYDRTVDWWCLGSVLYEMLYGLPPFYSRNMAEMYNNILHKPLLLKPNVSNSAQDLLHGLLQKDKAQRLGAKNDFLELKFHSFFSTINWDDLMARKIAPPFVPTVSGPTDLQHFDPEFTQQPVPNSVANSPEDVPITASMREAAEAFLGFSYVPPVDTYL